MRVAIALCLLVAGCGGRGNAVEITARFAGVAPADVRALKIEVDGAERDCSSLTIAGETEVRFVYRPAIASGHLELHLIAFGDAPAALAYGTGTVEVTGETRSLSVRIDGARAGEAGPASRTCAGTGGDGGSSGPGDGGDGGGGVTPSLCPGGFTLCDGFEDGTFGNWTRNDDPPRGTLSVDATRAFRGHASVRAHVEDAAADYVSTVLTVPRPVRPTFFRTFWFLPATTPRIDLLRFEGDAPPYAQLLLKADGPVLATDSSYLNTSLKTTSSTAVPHGRWACIELSLDDGSGGADGELRVWVDDVEVPELHRTGLAVAGLNHLVLGPVIQLAAGTPAFDVWFDEVVLDGKRIGCSR